MRKISFEDDVGRREFDEIALVPSKVWEVFRFDHPLSNLACCSAAAAAGAAEQHADAIAKFRCRDAHHRNKCSMTSVTKVTTDI